MDIKKSAISYITLGVADLDLMQTFYSGLGFDLHAKSETVNHPYSMFKSGSIILALYPKHLLAKQAGIHVDSIDENRSMSISLNVDSKEAVDDLLVKAEQLKAIISKQGFEPEWGGYCGYFKDPENNLWEIVWHPKFQF